jgi:hypothetical protein
MRSGTTFYWMPEDGCPPLGLSLESRLLMLLPLELLDTQMVLVDSYTQDYLGAILVNYKLVEVLPEHLGRDNTGADIACVAEGSPRGLVWLIEGRIALAAKV